MLKSLVFGLAAAGIALSAGAAVAQGYGDESAYDGGYGYDRGGYGYSRYGYGEDVTARARYCRAHAEFHRRQAWAISHGALNDPEWRQWNERAHAAFHYSHPGSWRCDYLPNGGAW